MFSFFLSTILGRTKQDSVNESSCISNNTVLSDSCSPKSQNNPFLQKRRPDKPLPSPPLQATNVQTPPSLSRSTFTLNHALGQAPASPSPIRRTLRHTLSRISLSSVSTFTGSKSASSAGQTSPNPEASPSFPWHSASKGNALKEPHYKLRRLQILEPQQSTGCQYQTKDYSSNNARYAELASLVSYIEHQYPATPNHSTSISPTMPAFSSQHLPSLSSSTYSEDSGISPSKNVKLLRYGKRPIISYPVLVSPSSKVHESSTATIVNVGGVEDVFNTSFASAASPSQQLQVSVLNDDDADGGDASDEEEDLEDISHLLSLFPSPASSRDVSPASTILTFSASSSSSPSSTYSSSSTSSRLHTPATSIGAFTPNPSSRKEYCITRAPTPTSEQIYSCLARASHAAQYFQAGQYGCFSSTASEFVGDESEISFGDSDDDDDDHDDAEENEKIMNPFYLEDEDAYYI